MTKSERQLQAIKQLEALSGKTLDHVTAEEFKNKRNAFSLNAAGEVTHLSIFFGELSDLTPLSTLTGLTTLYLSENQITNLTALSPLTGLTTLNLQSNQITDLSPLSPLTRLTNLYLSGNQITDLTPLAPLTGLTKLYLESNKITDLTPLAALTRLTDLRLMNNQITDLTPLSPLIRLTDLRLYNNKITDLNPLSTLTQLTTLYLSENQITVLTPLAALTGLKILSLSENQITDLNPLSALTGLTTLDLQSNQITDLTPLSPLTGLTDLRLMNNQITDLNPLAALTGLTYLDLDNNQITDLTPLSALTVLTQLYLNENQITDLTPLLPLVQEKKLSRLNLENNQIKHLPQPFLNLEIPITWEKNSWDNGIGLEGNPIETPPIEIVKQGHDAVVSYFKQLTEKVQLLQCKLLIVGSGEVGKTTLMKKLKDPSFNVVPGQEPTTHGINIIPWELPCTFSANAEKEYQRSDRKAESSKSKEQRAKGKEQSQYQPSVSGGKVEECTVKLFFWDFGGQDIYHATHQFFLTKRSVYILVWEARKEEESRSFDYWLNVIKLLGSGSPVIVVLNKADIRIKPIDQFSLQTKFPDIKGFLNVSCLNNSGLTELKQLITQTLEHMPHLNDLLPASWVHIRDELKSLDQNYISADEFYTLCEKHKINRDDAITIADYLHDLGTILYFRHDPLLRDTVILKPEWATTAVYKLLDTNEILLANGSFEFNDLKKYWDRVLYPESKHPQLVRLMEKFELCFNFFNTEKYFIPELVPGTGISFNTSGNTNDVEFRRGDLPVALSNYNNLANIYHQPGTLHFQYKYEFMPEGILSRFISRLYYLIRDNNFKKYWVELVFEKSSAVITSDPLNSRMQVRIAGSNNSELLAIIRSHLNHIHETLNMKAEEHYNEMIPCNCPLCTASISKKEPFYFPYSKLTEFRGKSISTVQCLNSGTVVSIEDLLNGFAPNTMDRNIYKSIVEACKQLIGLSMSMKEDEDSRTGLLCVLLSKDGYIVKDQTRWGISGTGRSMGRLDTMIKDPKGKETILEAFKLNNLKAETIQSHCRKIFGYDAAGFPENFIVVYCDCPEKDFLPLWEKYLEFVKKIQFDHQLKALDKIKDTGYTNIKMARAIHERQGEKVSIFHLFLLMGSA